MYEDSVLSHSTDTHTSAPRDRSYSNSVRTAGNRTVSIGSQDRERERSGGTSSAARVTRVEDVLRIVKERVFGWSYMMQWYQGYVRSLNGTIKIRLTDSTQLTTSDVHWFNTVRIPRSAVESSIGAQKLEARARQWFVLGASLAAVFDIGPVGDYLRALGRVLDDWESWSERGGGKGVVRHISVNRVAPAI